MMLVKYNREGNANVSTLGERLGDSSLSHFVTDDYRTLIGNL